MHDELLDLLEETAIIFPEFDACIAGVVARFGQDHIVCYDYRKVIDVLMQDMSEDDAVEHFHFNIIGSGLGPLTPCFLIRTAAVEE